jgi:diamine N-acetyltransferase
MMKERILFGNRVRLRAAEPFDLEFMYKIENTTDIWRFGSTLIPYSRHQIEQYILSSQHDLFTEKQLRLMIDLQPMEGTNAAIGMIDLYDFEPHHLRAGVGIYIVPEHQKQGYGFDALSSLIRYCKEILNLHMLHCNITANNKESIGLFEKAGFVQYGIRKEWQFQDGTWVDEVCFQLILQ